MFPAWLFLSALLLQTPSVPPQAALEKERGDNLVAASQLEAALRAYDEAIRQAPAYVEALNQRGVTLVRLGRMEEAVASFDRALALDPNYAMAVYNRGFALKKLGRHGEVVQAFSRYVQLMPDDASGYFQLAEGNYVQGDMAAALSAYERFLALETNPAQGNKIAHSKKRVAELQARLAPPAAEAPPPSAVPAAAAAARAPASAVPPTSVLFVTPEREALCNAKIAEGIALRAEGKLRDAVFALQDAVQANPQNPRALYELAEAYAAREYFAQAAARWERVLAMNPAPALRAQVQDRLAEAYRQMDARGIPREGQAVPGAPAVATPQEQKAAEVAPRVTSKPLSQPAREAFLKGAALFADRDYAGAVHQYDIAIVFHPDVSELYSARAAAWLASGDAERALADCAQARRLGPALALPLFGLAEAHAALQRNAEAIEHYRLFLASTAADATPEMIEKAKAQLEALQPKKPASATAPPM